MKLGIFDSGLGGLLIARAVRERLPDIDMLYYGDTLHLPYGNRSDAAIYYYTKQAMDYMFQQGCQLIVIACNTASAACLRRLQQEYLPAAWPGRNIIGVVVPTLEAAIDAGYQRLGLIGTNYIVRSGIYQEELQKLNASISLAQVATPLLVPLIEHDGLAWAPDILQSYLEQLDLGALECLILGCTHYPTLKTQIRAVLGPQIDVLSQDEIIPERLVDYLGRHSEYKDQISHQGRSFFHVSDVTDNYVRAAQQIYGADIAIEKSSESVGCGHG